jgi:diketogulonate reductase-like aldo/keto reductase
VEERRLGPVVGLGTWSTFGGNRSLAREVVGSALEAGVRVFDSSPMYGGAEASLGEALRERREGATVATKIWAPSVEEGRRQYEAQRRFFGRVELEQVHNLLSWEAQLSWLEAERAEGRVDRLGVTHYASGAFGELERALATGRFDAVQIPLNPLEREAERRILPLAEERGIAVVVMEPYGGTGAPLVRRSPPPEELEPLRELGIETWAQALLAWVLADPRVDVVIPATSRPERAAENARAGELPPLEPDARELIERWAAG